MGNVACTVERKGIIGVCWLVRKLLWLIPLVCLSVRLLVSGSGTWTTELLGLASSRVSDDQRSIVSDEGVSDLLLGGLIDVLLVVSQKTLSYGLTDGIDLGSVTTASDSDSHVDLGEILLTEQ